MVRNPSNIYYSFSVKSKISDAASNRVDTLIDGMVGRGGWGGNRQTVQNMLDAIFGVQLSGHLRFSHE